jgi:acyl-CoA thioester hydrolase
MKPDPQRLELRSYPHQFAFVPRFSDIDPQMHLNNVRIGEFYQEARISFFREIGRQFSYSRPSDSRTLVAHQSMDYLREVQYPTPLIIGIGVARVGTSSYELALGMFQQGRCVGLSVAVLVHANAQGPAPIPAEFRAVLQQNLLPAAAST